MNDLPREKTTDQTFDWLRIMACCGKQTIRVAEADIIDLQLTLPSDERAILKTQIQNKKLLKKKKTKRHRKVNSRTHLVLAKTFGEGNLVSVSEKR